jgi:hypothetical protein
MTSRNVLASVFLGLLACSSVGCPNKQKDGGASAEPAGSAAPAPAAGREDDKDKDDDDDDEDEEKDGKGDANKKDEGGW